MTTTYTPHYTLPKPAFDSDPWHQQMHDALTMLDAIIFAGIGVAGIMGVWENDTAYTVGQRVVDGDDASIWTCATGHTSAAAGTMAADRAANPANWTSTTVQLSPRGAWANDAVYAANDLVYDQAEGVSAIALTSHTSSAAPNTIRDDVANWAFIVDLAVAGGAASTVSYDNATSGLVAAQVQAAIDEVVVAIAANSAAIAAKAPLASPALTGDPTVPTQASADSSTKIANTAMVQGAIDILEAAVTAALADKAPLASPALTGTPTAPTQSAGNDSTRLATTAFVAALGALKANIASPALTGVPTAPTAAAATDTEQLATTAFVQDVVAARVPIRAVKLSNQNITSTSMVDLTDLSFAIGANETWVFIGALLVEVTTSSSKYVSVNGPAAPSSVALATQSLSGGTKFGANISAYDGDCVVGDTNGVDGMTSFIGHIANGANAGTVIMRGRAVSGTLGIPGGWLLAWRVA